MDTTDPEISFDSQGVCNHCRDYEQRTKSLWRNDASKNVALEALVDRIRGAGKGREYDCVIGVSGGVDSTFVAYTCKQLKLRPLAVHLDNGWDFELAVKNIELALNKLKIDLNTIVLNWEEFQDLQVSFLKASTPDSEIPTDHAIVASLFDTARKHNLKYIISGTIVRTESHLPRAWSTGHMDWKYIQAVHSRFGSRSLNTFPHRSTLRRIVDAFTIHWVDILNYVDCPSSADLRQIGLFL